MKRLAVTLVERGHRRAARLRGPVENFNSGVAVTAIEGRTGDTSCKMSTAGVLRLE